MPGFPTDPSIINPDAARSTFNKEAAEWLKNTWKGTEIEAKKIYTFNQTGNILYSTTVKTTPEAVPIQELNFPPEVQLEFEQVSLFMAALTKALANSWTGHYTKDGRKIMHSTYDYEAISRGIDKSGLWVQVAEEDVRHTLHSGEVDISKGLIEAVVGFATGGCSAITSMASAMGYAASKHDGATKLDGGPDYVEVGGRVESQASRVCQLIFVCENIFGSAHISLLVVSMDQHECSTHFQVGPCISESSQSLDLKMHKDTYMWVNPKTVMSRSVEILKGMEDHNEIRVVNHLKHFIENAADPYNPEATTITDELQLRLIRYALGKYQGALEDQQKNGVKQGEEKLRVSYENELLEDGVSMINWAIEKGAGYDGAWARWYDMEQNKNPPGKFKVDVKEFITTLKKEIAERKSARQAIRDARKEFEDAMKGESKPPSPHGHEKKEPEPKLNTRLQVGGQIRLQGLHGIRDEMAAITAAGATYLPGPSTARTYRFALNNVVLDKTGQQVCADIHPDAREPLGYALGSLWVDSVIDEHGNKIPGQERKRGRLSPDVRAWLLDLLIAVPRESSPEPEPEPEPIRLQAMSGGGAQNLQDEEPIKIQSLQEISNQRADIEAAGATYLPKWQRGKNTLYFKLNNVVIEESGQQVYGNLHPNSDKPSGFALGSIYVVGEGDYRGTEFKWADMDEDQREWILNVLVAAAPQPTA